MSRYLLNRYIIKIECGMYVHICSARRKKSFSFIGIKIHQP